MNWLKRLLGIHIHHWSHWTEIGKRKFYDELGRCTGFNYVMERTCHSCGLKQSREF